MMNRYGFDIYWSDEDQGFIATCPDFPGLSAFGETEEEALEEGKIACELFIESLQSNNESLPEVSKIAICSGQLRLRMPTTLHNSLAQKAKLEGVSLNTWIVNLLSERNAISKIADEIYSRLTKVEKAIQVYREEARQIFIKQEIPYNPLQEEESYGQISYH